MFDVHFNGKLQHNIPVTSYQINVSLEECVRIVGGPEGREYLLQG
jgi:hypothetical protein